MCNGQIKNQTGFKMCILFLYFNIVSKTKMSEADIVPNLAPISSTDQSNTTNVAPTTEVSAGSKRLHVTNLPFRIRDSDLHEMFVVNIHREMCRKCARFFAAKIFYSILIEIW